MFTRTASRRAGTQPAPSAAETRQTRRPTVAALVLVAVLLAGSVLRLWGVRHGLPYVYNLDEGAHFVKLAVRYFGEGYNPHYFQNPPAFSYLLHAVFAFGYGGIWPPGAGIEVKRTFSADPTELYTIGRVTAGMTGLAAAGVLYFVGKRLYGIGAGLVAATLMTISFLPVHYGHLALNDIPTLLPLTVGLLGVVLIHERGDWPAYLLAAAGLGLATAFKYTAAALAVPIVVAAALRVHADRESLRPELTKLVVAGAFSLLVFALANPYAVIEPREFGYYVRRQQRFSGEVGKLGLDDIDGWRYYLWTLTWGYGWVALALSAVGTVFAVRKDWRKALLLLSFIVTFWLVMGSQMRFYARWFLPVYPFLAVLAGYGVAQLAEFAKGRWKLPAAIAIVAVALVQPLVTIVHNDRVLTRTDTRELARDWLLEHFPRGRRIVVEQIASPGFARVREDRSAPHLWRTYRPPRGRVEEYVARLRPRLLDDYAKQGFCVVVTGSNQRDRVSKDPASVPRAVRYYRRLESEAERVAVFSPVKAGDRLPKFNFDWSYDYYPMAYDRPGPEVVIYRLRNGFCRDQPVLRGDAGTPRPLPPVRSQR